MNTDTLSVIRNYTQLINSETLYRMDKEEMISYPIKTFLFKNGRIVFMSDENQ